MKTGIYAVMITIMLANFATARAECFADGHKWDEWNRAPENLGEVMQLGFTRGFVDTMVLWHKNAGIEPSWVETCVVPKSASEVRNIFTAYVAKNPRNKDQCMSDLALAALTEACSTQEN